jgi:hypothetical protein
MKNNLILRLAIILLSIIAVSLLLVVIAREAAYKNENPNETQFLKKDIKGISKGLSELKDYEFKTPLEYFEAVSESTNTATLKSGFIKLVDFIFYGDKIKGVTFSELTDDIKLKVINIGYKIDSKIDQIFPGYKEKISTGVKRIYTNIKERLTELYISVTNKICTSRPSLCENAKEGFSSMKESFGITWDMLKNIYNNSKEKVSDWYLEYKNS